MFSAVTSPVPPGATPGGRALVKLPVTYTMLLTTTWLQTTPLICQVGNASALMVGGTPAGGLVSAMAAGGPASVASVIALTAAVAHNRPFVIILAPRDVV